MFRKELGSSNQACFSAPPKVVMAALSDEKPYEHQYSSLTLDTGPILRSSTFLTASRLLSLAPSDKYYTTPNVVAEIRDPTARKEWARVCSAVSGLEEGGSNMIDQVPEWAMKAVCDVARKTGDYASLSLTDLKVIAVGYWREVTDCGTGNLRDIDNGPEEGRVKEKKEEKEKNEEEKKMKKKKKKKSRRRGKRGGKKNKDNTEQEGGEPVDKVDAAGGGIDGAKKSVWVTADSGDKVAAAAGSAYDDTNSTDSDSGSSSDDEEESISSNSSLDDPSLYIDSDCSISDEEDDRIVVLDEDEVEFRRKVGQENFDKAMMAACGDKRKRGEGNEISVDDEDEEEEEEEEEEFPSLGESMARLDVEQEDGTTDNNNNIIEDTTHPDLTPEEVEERKAAALRPLYKRPDSQGKMYNSFGKYANEIKAGGVNFVPKKKKNYSSETPMAHLKVAAGLPPTGYQKSNDDGESRITNSAMGGMVTMTAEDDDGEGWVGAGAFSHRDDLGVMTDNTGFFDEDKKDRKKKDIVVSSTSGLRPAIATTDFAMQNVILRMGLLLASVDGESTTTGGSYKIKTLKSWVMRCPACFHVAAEGASEKLFCSKCGNSGLERIAASTDPKTGERRLHLSKKRRDKNIRGTKFSLPKAGNQGRYDGDLLLREDQLMSGNWSIKVRKGKDKQQSVFGEDVTDGIGLTGDLTKRDDIKVGFGRRNPNSAKTGRERRGKKKKQAESFACGMRRNF